MKLNRLHAKLPGVAPCRATVLAIGLMVTTVGGLVGANDTKEKAAPVFERDVRPILKAHCFHCHGEGEKLKGGVDLRLRRFMLGESDSGAIMTPGDPGKSVLLELVKTGEMPKDEKSLTAEQIEVLEHWIAVGAPTLRPEPEEVPKYFITEEERAFWAFQPVHPDTPPVVNHPERVRTPIDAFLLERLENDNLTFAPPADRHTLIRRVTIDLTGLPPTPEEVDAFVTDDSPDAYEKVVDRLLASERYGERWGRHWLDVAGYADSNGGSEADSERAWAWRYRDYVIRSFNADKPFDQFIIEQLAGDELVEPPYGDLDGEDLDKLIATGFLRMAPDPTADGAPDPDLAKNQVIADTIQIVSSSLLGLTVQCAQCHDHRYDPIPQSDYYRLRAVFEPAFDWKHWKNPNQRLVSLMPREDRELAECIETRARAIDAQAQKLHDQLIEEFVQQQLELVPEEMREPVMVARRTPARDRTEAHKQLLREFPTFQDHIILGEVNREGANQVEAIRKRSAEERAGKPTDPMVHCLIEEPGKNLETFVFARGDHQQPKEAVNPGDLTVLAAGAVHDIPPTNALMRTTGRRLAFARSLTCGSHPLTSRVLVNRVWHHYFGTGVVSTLGDLGTLGSRPTHPELLDWLAGEFVASGWKLKSLHRLLVTSEAYRQGSVNEAAQAVDPDNRLLGRMSLRRLDSEAVRDSLLAIAGRLNPQMYGPPVPVAVNPQGQIVVGSQKRDVNGFAAGVGGLGESGARRSIYVQVRRSMRLGMLETFDTAALSPNCEARSVSTVAPQALMLMNDQFVVDRADELAERLRREHPGDLRGQLVRLWQLAFSTTPAEEELQRSLVFLAEQTETIRASLPAPEKDKPDEVKEPSQLALASLCQAVLGSNRFLYLE